MALPLSLLQFDNHFISALPADPITDNNCRQVAASCYSYVKPDTVLAPQLLCYAKEVAKLIGLSHADCQSDLFTQVFAGNVLVSGMQPYAQCYGGHQFGNWAGQLGDGRAINLGDVVTAEDQHYTLQLKGAGKTPYSRHADGLAVLRSSVREFLCSEAMFHLGIPTTRALSVITTGQKVVRDMFYNGYPQDEPGAITCRASPSFLRFGSYEIHAARDDIDTLKSLVDYTIKQHFPHLSELGLSVDVYLRWFEEVCDTTAALIVEWMRVGFVHGVMNTDNMSVLGLTIDYGPYGWLESYDPDWTPNTTDSNGRRYCFGNQPQIAQWNLLQLANALYPLIGQAEPLCAIIDSYAERYRQKSQVMCSKKLGLATYRKEDNILHNNLHEILQITETDMTIFYRKLADIDNTNSKQTDTELLAPLMDAYYSPDTLTADDKIRISSWLRQYQQRLQAEGVSDYIRRQRMNIVNPKYVLRNYMVQLAIDKAEQGDPSLINDLLELARHPYDEQPDKIQFFARRPNWARHRAGCSMLSCSS